MKSISIKFFFVCSVFLFCGIVSFQTVYAIPYLEFPSPNIFISTALQPSFDAESGLVKGELILKNTGGNYVGAFQISVWIEGLEAQTKVNAWVNNMPGYGYTRSFTYHFNCNTGNYIPNKAYWVMAELDNNGISRRSNGYFEYTPPGFIKPNLTFDFTDQSANGYVYNSQTNEITFSTVVINQGTDQAGSFVVSWYLSDDETIDTTDIEIGWYTVSQGLSALSQPYPLPTPTFNLGNLSGLLPGNYYVGVIIDSNEEVAEEWEDDNASPFSNLLVWGESTGPVNLTFSTSEDDHDLNYIPSTHELSVTNYIENTGAFQSGKFRVSRYLYSSSLGFFLFDRNSIEVAPYGKEPIIKTIDLDYIGLPNGQYTVVVYIDDQNVVSETDATGAEAETDNLGSFSIDATYIFEYNDSTKANLIFYQDPDENIEIFMQYFSDHYIYLSTGIGNSGQTDAPAFKVGYYLSDDTIINPYEDYFLWSWDLSSGLAAGTGVGNIALKDLDLLAPDLPHGTYYLGMYIDHEFTVDEYNENIENNSSYFGDPTQIIEWIGPLCQGDIDGDADVDGLDLNNFIIGYGQGLYQTEHIPIFAQHFGRVGCPPAPTGAGAQQNFSIPSSPIANRSQVLAESTSAKEPDISWKPIEDKTTTVTTEENSDNQTGTFLIEEVVWKNSNGQEGTAVGNLDWQIHDITLDPGTNTITVTVRDAMGNIGEKTIEVIQKEILSKNGDAHSKKWIRRFTYEYNFDEVYIQDTPTAADLTLFCWPDKIVMVDDYLNFEDMDNDELLTEDAFKYQWSMECNKENEKVLFLDIPIDTMKSN